jgi:hypothetical protein
MAQPQALVHDFAPQVQIAVLEPDLLPDRLVELERQRLRAVQHLQLPGQELDPSGCEIRVRSSRRPLAHQASHADHVLVPQFLRLLEHLGGIRIENDLQQSLPIAQIDEDHPTVIAPTMNPAGYGNFRPGRLFIYLTAVM